MSEYKTNPDWLFPGEAVIKEYEDVMMRVSGYMILFFKFEIAKRVLLTNKRIYIDYFGPRSSFKSYSLSIFYKEDDYRKAANNNALLLKEAKIEKGCVSIQSSGSFSNNQTIRYRIKNDFEFIQENINKFSE